MSHQQHPLSSNGGLGLGALDDEQLYKQFLKQDSGTDLDYADELQKMEAELMNNDYPGIFDLGDALAMAPASGGRNGQQSSMGNAPFETYPPSRNKGFDSSGTNPAWPTSDASAPSSSSAPASSSSSTSTTSSSISSSTTTSSSPPSSSQQSGGNAF
jgi:hypothetical protein